MRAILQLHLNALVIHMCTDRTGQSLRQEIGNVMHLSLLAAWLGFRQFRGVVQVMHGLFSCFRKLAKLIGVI
jgi:hypothetical protein